MQWEYKSFTEIVHLPWEKPFSQVFTSLYFIVDAFKNDAFKNEDFLQEELLFLNLKCLKKWT